MLYVAQAYPEWQHQTLTKLREMYNEVSLVRRLSVYHRTHHHSVHTHTHTQADSSLPPNKEVLEALKSCDFLKGHMKKLMPFVQHVKVGACGEQHSATHGPWLPLLCPSGDAGREGA